MLALRRAQSPLSLTEACGYYCRELPLEVPRIEIVVGTVILHGITKSCSEPVQSGEPSLIKNALHGFRMDCLIKCGLTSAKACIYGDKVDFETA